MSKPDKTDTKQVLKTSDEAAKFVTGISGWVALQCKSGAFVDRQNIINGEKLFCVVINMLVGSVIQKIIFMLITKCLLQNILTKYLMCQMVLLYANRATRKHICC
jgi:hypothetical protein